MSCLTCITSISSSDRKSVNSKLVSNSITATTTEPVVSAATASITHTAFFLWNSVTLEAVFSNWSPPPMLLPTPLSATICVAPTVTVLAMKAETTPSAKVIPNVLRGGSGEKEFERKAKTVVMTARVNAILSDEKDSTQASAAVFFIFLAFS